MRLTVVGTGYVGLVTGACFAEMGNRVTCVDTDEAKIAALHQGRIPIHEPSLDAMVAANVERGNLRFTTNLADGLPNCQIAFIAVGTPMAENGSADLSHVLTAARDIGRLMTAPLTIVDKSTVPVGTADKVCEAISAELRQRGLAIEFHVVSNPEFLKEGAAVSDFMKPDRVVVGTDSEAILNQMKELYHPFTMNHERLITMDVRSAEMTKYAANAMLATKISFMNEMANICERVGADINKVRVGIGSDRRIGYGFIYPGCGYGGSCFPKDVRALIKTAGDHGYETRLINAVEAVNRDQKRVLADKICRHFADQSDDAPGQHLAGRCLAIWGLAFKPETDDMRESPAIDMVRDLVRLGARVNVYDPKVSDQAREWYLRGLPHTSTRSKYDALDGADALVLLTEWKEFRSPDFQEIHQRLRHPVIFDGRNQYDGRRLAELGFSYHQIGVADGVCIMRA